MYSTGKGGIKEGGERGVNLHYTCARVLKPLRDMCVGAMRTSKSSVSGWTTDGDYVESVSLRSEKLAVTLLAYGARLLDVQYEGCSILRGFKTVEEIGADGSYAGAAVGRVCNRVMSN